jgi:hypothetical protein
MSEYLARGEWEVGIDREEVKDWLEDIGEESSSGQLAISN